MSTQAPNTPTSQPAGQSSGSTTPAGQTAPALPGLGRRALVTGVSGFTGRHVEKALAEAGYQVFGLSQHGGAGLGTPGGGPVCFVADLCSRTALSNLVAMVQPDVVVHLAAVSFVAHEDADAIYRTNIVATRNLLEALAAAPHRPRAVLLASSANIYGNAEVEPITEDTPPAPTNDYSVSKLAMEHMAHLWQDRLPITIVRPFNYTGVGQAERFLVPKIVTHFQRRAASIELGNLDVERDFSDVRMVASCYTRLLELDTAGQTFNLCSGIGTSLLEMIAMLEQATGHKMEIKVNPTFVRTNEVKRLVGSNARLAAALAASGGLGQIPLADTLGWMVTA